MKNHVSKIGRDAYVVRSGRHVLVVERAKLIVRRAGRFVGQWLKYLVGTLSTTGERIWVCLGHANREDVRSWVYSSNGGSMLFVLRLMERMIEQLGFTKCLAIATIALQGNW